VAAVLQQDQQVSVKNQEVWQSETMLMKSDYRIQSINQHQEEMQKGKTSEKEVVRLLLKTLPSTLMVEPQGSVVWLDQQQLGLELHIRDHPISRSQNN
jgi:hypothetical protein